MDIVLVSLKITVLFYFFVYFCILGCMLLNEMVYYDTCEFDESVGMMK